MSQTRHHSHSVKGRRKPGKKAGALKFSQPLSSSEKFNRKYRKWGRISLGIGLIIFLLLISFVAYRLLPHRNIHSVSSVLPMLYVPDSSVYITTTFSM